MSSSQRCRIAPGAPGIAGGDATGARAAGIIVGVRTRMWAPILTAVAAAIVTTGLLAGALLPIVSAGATVVSATPTSKCANAAVIGVRGSGDTAADAGGLGLTVAVAADRIRKAVGNKIDAQAIDYPALGLEVAFSSPAQYYAGTQAGIDALTAAIQTQAATCPNEPIALLGYSQGAMVVNRALVGLGATQPALLKKIAAVELIADPQRLGTAPYVTGSAPAALNGLGIYATGLRLAGVGFPADDLPAAIQARVRSTCVTGDIVCAYDASKSPAEVLAPASLAAAGKAHTSYATNGEARRAGADAARKLRRAVRNRRRGGRA